MLKQGNILLPLISAIAIVAVVAAGYFFWVAYVKPPMDTQNRDQVPKTDTPQLPNATSTWKSHTNDKFGFSLKYPQDYDLEDRSDNPLVMLFSPLDPKGGRSEGLGPEELKIEIYVEPSKENDSSEMCYSDHSEGERPMGSSEKLISGINAVSYHWVGLGEGESTCLIHNGNRYILNKYPYQTSRQKEYDQIISTFKFAKNTSTQNKATTQVKVFFNNKKLANDPGMLDCGKVFAVNRTVPETKAVATAAMTEWLKGPTREETTQGYSGGTNGEVSLRSVKVDSGLATVDLEFGKNNEGGDGINKFIGPPCMTESFTSQVNSTLKQFFTIKNVQIAKSGSVDEFNSWASNP